MRRIFYYYNSHGALIFEYRDNSGRYIDRCYLYSLSVKRYGDFAMNFICSANI